MAQEAGLTLTQLAHVGRQTIKFGLIALVVLMVGRTVLTAATGYWRATHPPKLPPPTAGFGVLPPLRMTEKSADEKPTSYVLETATGGFPLFPDRAKIFLMGHSTPSLLADQQVKEIASQFGYVFPPTILNERTYRWTKSQPIPSTLEMDIQTKNFTMTSNFLSRPELFNGTNLPSDAEATELMKGFIESGMKLPADIATSSGQITFLHATGDGVVGSESFSDADFIQVDIFRSPVDDLAFYSEDGQTGNIHGIVSGGTKGRDALVELAYKLQPMIQFEAQEYPLRPVQSAWQLLQAGEGYVAKKGTVDPAVIREVELGYYEDLQIQNYMQPIYIFKGDGGFLGYVPAIDPRFTQQNAAVQ